jgi:hypothetical protein
MDGMKGIITGVVLLIVGIVVIFYIVGGTSSTLTAAATNISGSGLPLASLFSSSGVVLMIFMAGLLLAIIGMTFKWVK